MGHSPPDDDFEQFAPSRFGDGRLHSDPSRPDWLTRVGDTAGPEPGFEPPAPEFEPPAPRPPAEKPRDADSWEGAVARARRQAAAEGSDHGFKVRRAGGFPFRALQSALGRLAGSRSFLILVVAAFAVIAVLMFRPREEQTASIVALRKHPERFEGRPVKIRGKVGEVFTVGGGYAFHLHQGRENIVVFTRSRVPVRREQVTITGTISNGTLDGKTRQALFETP